MFLSLIQISANSCFRAFDNVDKIYFLNFIQKLSQIILIFVFTQYYPSLEAFVISFSLSIFIQIFISLVYLKKLIIFNLFHNNYSLDKFFNVLLQIAPNSIKLGVVALSSFFITKFSTFLITASYEQSIIASYGLFMQVIFVIQSFSSIVLNINLPKFIRFHSRKSSSKQIILLYKSFFLLFLIYFFSVGIVFIFGPFFIDYFAKDVLFPNLTIMILMSIFGYLEINHSIAATYISSTNSVPFLKASVLSALFITIFSCLAIYFQLGLVSVILSYGLVQLAYNNWKWPYELYKIAMR